MNDFVRGAVTAVSLAVGLFFLRYWRTTRDRLFLMFCAAFWLLAFNWLLAAFGGPFAGRAYIFRFLAFVVIAVAVLDKNRRQSPPPASS